MAALEVEAPVAVLQAAAKVRVVGMVLRGVNRDFRMTGLREVAMEQDAVMDLHRVAPWDRQTRNGSLTKPCDSMPTVTANLIRPSC
jgi:hypothetical protein